MNNFFTSKTNLTAIGLLITAAIKTIGIDVPPEVFVGEAGLIALFMRMSISKNGTGK